MERLKGAKESKWGDAFHHKYYENKITTPVHREYNMRGMAMNGLRERERERERER